MHFINGLLLSVTFIASIALLAVLQQRRLIRRLFLFVVLLVFYVLRSAVLIIGMRLLDRALYVELASVMSLADLALQLAVAWSLIHSFTQARPGRRGRQAARFWNSALILFAVGLVVAGALTVVLVSALPIHSPVPLDRGILFSGLMFLLLAFVPGRTANAPENRLLVGFCAVSTANILAQYGRMFAAAQHDARLFLGWTYANIAVWVCVLVFWILRLQPGTDPVPSGTEELIPSHPA